jgi:hypothetical protein
MIRNKVILTVELSRALNSAIFLQTIFVPFAAQEKMSFSVVNNREQKEPL